MFTATKIKTMFTWAKPKPAQVKKYRSIAAVFDETFLALAEAPQPDKSQYQGINDKCSELVTTMVKLAPKSADLSAAVRCVRLARNAFNARQVALEKVIAGVELSPSESHLVHSGVALARNELLKAKWQANASIALSGAF